ncbi:unnamed protein product [Adineta ricciae]|uniref:Uncharacterized protein n=1 Tax=Adineta ricciae TaxID=249248 RepID=A0A815QNC1_ADIRI|nr:unnamed protein product [Adineta ricciae]
MTLIIRSFNSFRCLNLLSNPSRSSLFTSSLVQSRYITLSTQSTSTKVSMNRQVREEIIADVLNLYNSNPTEESFRHYAPNAQFEDPLQFSGNLSSIKSAFKSLPKIFKDSEVTKSDAQIDTNPMKLNLETRYEWKEQIIRHEERWNGEPIPNAESGFFGRIKEALRHATGSLVHAAVDSEKPVEKH